MQSTDTRSIWSRNFIQIMAVNILAQLSVQMINTTIVPYALWLGAAASMAGVISGVNFMASLIMRPFSGMLTNHTDKRRLLALSILIFLISSFGLVFSSTLPLILLMRGLQGIAYAFITTLCMTIVADILQPERIGEGIGYFGLSQCIAQMAGPAIGLKISAAFGYTQTYMIVFIFFAASLLCVRFLPPMPSKSGFVGKKIKISFNDLIAKESLVPTTIGLLFSILNSCLAAFLSVYAASKNLDAAPVFFAISAATMFAARLIGAKSADHRSLAFTGTISGSLLISAMLLLGLGSSVFTMWMAAAVFGIGYGLLLPVTQSRSVSAPPPERHGTGSSTYFIGIDLGFSIGNVLGGIIAQHLGYSNMYLCLIIPAVAAIALALAKGRDR